MANLQYHQPTFDMLKITPVFSETAISALNRREQELGIKFPASVREWFSIEGVHEIIHQYSNDDYLCEIAKIGKKRLRYSDDDLDEEPDEYYDQTKLAILLENQGGFEVSFCLDGSDDPPVWIWDDDQVWRQLDHHFSRYIYGWIWNFLYYRSSYKLQADADLPSPNDLALLRTHLTEIKLESSFLYCFEGIEHHLQIYQSYDEKIVWWLEAASAETLYNLAKIVGQCSVFANSKFNTFRGSLLSKENSAVLERLENDEKA